MAICNSLLQQRSRKPITWMQCPHKQLPLCEESVDHGVVQYRYPFAGISAVVIPRSAQKQYLRIGFIYPTDHLHSFSMTGCNSPAPEVGCTWPEDGPGAWALIDLMQEMLATETLHL